MTFFSLKVQVLQFYTTNWFKIFKEYFIRIQKCFYILTSCTRPHVAVVQFV